MLETRSTVEIREAKRDLRNTGARVKPVQGKASAKARPPQAKGLKVGRVFSSKGVNPLDAIEWEKRKATIGDDKGQVIFEQENVEWPKSWSMLATNIVASKYFYGDVTKKEREFSVRQLVHRVSRTIADWGVRDGYFNSREDAETFYDELTFLLVNQYGAFNSTVWFNCGLYHQYGVGKQSGAGNYYFDPKKKRVKQASTQYE